MDDDPNDFKLPVLKFAGKTLFANYAKESRASAQEDAEKQGGVVRPFWAGIKKTDLNTGEVTDWERREGFSVWV